MKRSARRRRAVANSSHIDSAIGIIFTVCLSVYLSVCLVRLRVEKAKYLLQYPHFRVGENTFATGFGSLCPFL